MGEPWGLWGVFNTFDELQAEAVRADAKLYLVASTNEENGDLYVYREKYNDFIFLNNVIYDLAFQIVQGPPGRNYLTFIKGEHCLVLIGFDRENDRVIMADPLKDNYVEYSLTAFKLRYRAQFSQAVLIY
jgi:hypothetical protein